MTDLLPGPRPGGHKILSGSECDGADAPAPQNALRTGVECRIPETICIGKGNALYLRGWCYHATQRISRLEIVAGTISGPVKVYGAVRPDVFSLHHPSFDPLGYSFRSGFWGTLAIPEGFTAEPVEICLRATLESGQVCASKIATVVLVAAFAASPAQFPQTGVDQPLVAICLATCNPPLALFRRQIKSLLEQSYVNWVCIVSDDCSRPEAYSEIFAAIGEDPRFCAFRSSDRLGFYRNFERCLSFVPIEAAFVAFCDQDDVWHTDKLESLLAAFDPAISLAYSDMRIVDSTGRFISETYWTTRVNNYRSLTSLLIANTVTGAASMFRRDLLELALPFPELPGEPYHDHWIACIALAAGKVAYVQRPLYDYVQHDRNVIGHFTPASASWWRNAWLVLTSQAALGHTLALYRNIYFGEVLRVELIAGILQQRCRNLLDIRKRVILRRFSRIDGFLTCLWMAVRRVREIWRGNETLAAETRLLRGVLWRHCSVLRSRFGPGPRFERVGRRR